jgi:hypothetical protein
MADFLFRSRRANVGHGAEGPRQHAMSYLIQWDPPQRVGPPSSPLLRRPGLQISLRVEGFILRVEGFTLRIEGPRRKPPQNNSSPNPFLRPNPLTGDFSRHEPLFPLFTSRVSQARFWLPAFFTGTEGPWQDANATSLVGTAPSAAEIVPPRSCSLRRGPALEHISTGCPRSSILDNLGYTLTTGYLFPYLKLGDPLST